jgi:hypothetical protein
VPDVPEWIDFVVRARWLVACLGESASPPWWRSEATSPASRRMLERLYPRTALAASLETAGRAVAIEHDERISRIGTHHLFRLPAADEIAVHEHLQRPEGVEALRSLAALDGAEHLLGALAALAGEATAHGAQGPVRCGTVDEVRSRRTLQRMCAAYLAGFRGGRPVYPYLDNEGRS